MGPLANKVADWETMIARIEELPETDQLILSLRLEQSLSFPEIGAILDLEPDTVQAMFRWASEYVRAP